MTTIQIQTLNLPKNNIPVQIQTLEPVKPKNIPTLKPTKVELVMEDKFDFSEYKENIDSKIKNIYQRPQNDVLTYDSFNIGNVKKFSCI